MLGAARAYGPDMPTRRDITLLTMLAATTHGVVHAQEASPNLMQLVRAAQGQPNGSDPVRKLDAAITQMLDPKTERTKLEYSQGAQYLLHGQMPARASRIVQRGLELFENDAALLEMLGMTEFSQCQTVTTDAEMRAHARAAVDAFRRAREAGATTPTCRLLPWQAHIIDGRCDKALAAIDELAADQSLKRMMPDTHLARGMAMLGSGRYAEALAELTHKDMAMQVRMGTESMAARAEALAGKHKEAIQRAKAIYDRRKDSVALGLYVDTLAFAGKYDEALGMLKANPIVALKGEPAVRVTQRKQSRAAFEYLIGLRGKVPANKVSFVRDLADHLGQQTKSEENKHAIWKHSPLLIAGAARKSASGPKGWANDLLILAAISAWDTSATKEGGRAIAEKILDRETVQAFCSDGSKQRAMQLLRATGMRDDYEGTLVAIQLGATL